VVKGFDMFCAKYPFLLCYAIDCTQQPAECRSLSKNIQSGINSLQGMAGGVALFRAILPRTNTLSSNRMSAPFALSLQANNDSIQCDADDCDAFKGLQKWALNCFDDLNVVKRFETMQSFLSSFHWNVKDDSTLFRAVLITSKSSIPSAWKAVSLQF